MDRELITTAASAILAHRGWCVVEACTDIQHQCWEARLLVFGEDVEAVIDAIAEEIEYEPGVDLRLTGCCRRTLTPNAEMGAYLCYVAPSVAGDAAGVAHEPLECGDGWPLWSDRGAHEEP